MLLYTEYWLVIYNYAEYRFMNNNISYFRVFSTGNIVTAAKLILKLFNRVESFFENKF